MNTRDIQAGCAMLSLLALTACGSDGSFDPDLRGLIGGMDTAAAAASAAPRPTPDARGVISFSNGQVAVAQTGDTPATIAARLGLDAAALATHNALPADAPMQAGAVLVLPTQVAAAAPAGGGTAIVTDPFADSAPASPGVARADPAPAPASDGNPREHVVTAGETAWAIARRYDVSVQDLASWNGLPADMSLRTGQRLLVPQPGQAPDRLATTAPGAGSPTPTPPSATRALPDEETPAAGAPAPDTPQTDLGSTRTAASGGGQFRMPVDGSIIRVYEKGQNDGIDIAATGGAAVIAAGSGQVAAITRDSAGTPIIVVRHEGDLMSVYTNLGDVAVAKGDSVSAGQSLGQAGDAGFVHFEIRRGFESVDPERYLN
ncbi:LysM peptidoglycan-binding domain-containing protein [Paracoccus sp. Ld10]|uniref:LysM peptidoglycan-binding domain-containing protein n=1 Tax=Paracoccus sp. Ld10 TaxID=649158 RepID=UPI00386B39E7